jgi:MinD superfamily P-loop ATPase
LYFTAYQHYKDLGIILVDRASILSCMKIVVLGRAEKALNAIENIASDTYYYVSDVEEALEVVENHRAEMLVIENGASAKNPIKEIITELNRMTQEVRIIVLSPSCHYFIVANNTLNSSINYFITGNTSPEAKSANNN